MRLIKRKYQESAFVGTNGEEDAPGWHHDDFLVKDEALPVAVNYYVENALFLLDYFKEQDDWLFPKLESLVMQKLLRKEAQLSRVSLGS